MMMLCNACSSTAPRSRRSRRGLRFGNFCDRIGRLTRLYLPAGDPAALEPIRWIGGAAYASWMSVWGKSLPLAKSGSSTALAAA